MKKDMNQKNDNIRAGINHSGGHSQKSNMDIFMEDTPIPAIVEWKAGDAFEKIRKEAAAAPQTGRTASARVSRRPRRRYAVIGLAAALAVGGAAFASEQVFHWSRGISGAMQADHEQMASAQRSGLSDTPDIEILSETEADTAQASAGSASDQTSVTSVTHDGVTVSVDQTLVDNYRAIISLKIHGLKLDENADAAPDIRDISCDIDDVDANWSGGFYDGTIAAADGTVLYDDGSAVDWNAQEPFRYTDENGDYEFDIYYTNDGEAGALIGKTIHVTISEIGELIRNEEKNQYDYTALTDQPFTLEWTLKGSDQIRIVTFGGTQMDTRNFAGSAAEENTEASSQSGDSYVVSLSGSGSRAYFTVTESDQSGAIGDTGAVITQAEISPISIRLTMNWPYQDETEMSVDEDGNESMAHTWAQAPTLFALKMKDGTIFRDAIEGTAMEGYTDESSGTYVDLINLQRIIDPDQVSALMFLTPEAVQKIEDHAVASGDERYDFSILTDDDYDSVSIDTAG